MTKVKRKTPVIQIARLIVQLLAFVFFPGIFILTFDGIKEIYISIAAGSFNFLQALPRMAEVITMIPVTIFIGRFFCGWLCAFGAFNDFVYLISSKIFKIKFKIDQKFDSILKLIKYVVLAAAVYLIWIEGSTLFDGANPWDAFAQLPNIKDAVTQYTVGSILLIAIIIGAMFIERFFCRYLCPLGAIFAITSKLRVFNIYKPRDKCGSCRLCTNKCAMGIQLYKHDEVTSGECINCFKCVEACPRKNPRASMWNEDVNHLAAAVSAIVLIGGLYAATNFAGKVFTPVVANNTQVVVSNNNNSVDSSKPAQEDSMKNQPDSGNTSNSVNSNSSSKNSSEESAQNATTNNNQTQYKDGTYTGTGRGYRPGLNVSVTIKGGKITDVQVGSNNETPRFSQWAFNTVPSEILDSQSADVDAVSGATRSSNGIMQAVDDALSKAKK